MLVGLKDGQVLRGVVFRWTADQITVGSAGGVRVAFAPAEIQRASVPRQGNRWEKGTSGVLLGLGGGVTGVLATADSRVPGGSIGMAGGAAIGVATAGRAKTVDYEAP